MGLLILTVTAGGVAAQETTASPTTEEPTGETATVSLSPTTQITEWEYRNGTFFVTIDAKIPTQVVITDAGKLSKALAEGGGAASAKVRQRTLTVTPGETTIQFRAEKVEGAGAITLASSNGDGLAVLRSDAIGTQRDAIEWGSAGILIVAAATGAGYWSYRRMKKKLEEKRMEVERVV
ncbi:hypothetical protein [Halobellus inordinatus]|uniref:hypothetical protein n=1 Tax=Halobellus inordinatus TaxID=1126236 RepID=UPI002115A97D|nr:hypothetical protein [Halobellus ramosii]